VKCPFSIANRWTNSRQYAVNGGEAHFELFGGLLGCFVVVFDGLDDAFS
jgi:hypothetical protein